jgi:hypothetical protein
MHQDALTIMAPVSPARRREVEQVLEEMKINPGFNRVLPFGELPGCHFGRVVLVPSAPGPSGDVRPDALLLASDCDGSADDHLRALVDTAGDGLDRLFGACDDYPSGRVERSERLEFLTRKRLRPSAYYVHKQGRTVNQIETEEYLRKQLQAFTASHRFSNGSALHAREEIRAFVQNDPALAWALKPAPTPSLAFKLREALHHASLPLGIAALWPVAVPAIAGLLLWIRVLEASDHSDDVKPSPAALRALTELEDLAACSGYTAAAFLKPGAVRRLTVHALLELIGWGARHVFTRSSLAGVRTIHFARWIPLGDGRVVFLSNYDGSVESYNNDFIDLVGAGLNLIFSNAYGFPRTTWLIRGGALQEQKFKDYLRRKQLPTPVWHSAYNHLTVAHINDNAKLRAGLSADMNEEEARKWLRLI